MLSCGGWLWWRVTHYNAGAQIREIFPEARPFVDPYRPPAILSAGIHALISSYFGKDERLGFSLTDFPQPLDLQASFAGLSHLDLFSVHFTRCKITSLRPAVSAGVPDLIVFDDCDFFQLPAEQRQLLRPFDPSDPKAAKKFYIGAYQ